jgi:geranylgeranyl transferase type-1 subunit beta
MLDRQTTWIEEDEDDEEDQNEDSSPSEDRHEEAQPASFDMSQMQDGLHLRALIAGFCGRCGKIADTCYCFWNVGALAVCVSK